MTLEMQANSYAAGTYSYDGDGRRVKRSVGVGGQSPVETWQVYGLGGELLAEYPLNGPAATPQKEYGYRNGQLLVTATVTSGWGAAPTLHDNPLVVNETTVQARHITELRDAINALRSHLNMSPYSWQYSVTTNDWITANPILEMRIAMDLTLGAPTNGYASGLATDQPVMAIHIQELRDRVLGAWNNSGSTDVRWLVSDQLGTPRMIFDQTGSLANVSRHDYLPFGEELFAGTGGRTQPEGYTSSENVRQKFTSKERDSETGLDYFLARFYSSTQGRFTSPDEFKGGPHELWLLGSGDPEKQALVYADVTNPQSLNKYQYAFNNPLRYVDPDGHQGEAAAAITWTVELLAGGEAAITLTGVGPTAVVVVVTAAAAVIYVSMLQSVRPFRTNSATNSGIAQEPTSRINAAVNLSVPTTILTVQQKTLKKAASVTASALAHIGYLQNGKPDCPPGSQCHEDNKDHWRDEIRGYVKKLETYLKRLKGRAREDLEKDINQIKKDASL